MTGLNGFRHPLGGCVRDWILADDGDRRGLTAADAGRVQHAHAGAEQRRQFCEQLVRSGEVAGDRVADTDGNRRRRRLALFDHVEVVVERRHLVDFRHRHLHLGRERDQMRRGQAAVPVLNLVQVLDQEIAAARRIAEQSQDILARLRVDSPSFRRRAHSAAATALLLFRGRFWRG